MSGAPACSRGSAVSELTDALWTEYEAFQALHHPLGDVPLLALFLDGVYEPLRRDGVQREAVLVAWAITREGRKVLLSLALGNRESHEAWRDFLRDLVARAVGPADDHDRRRARPGAGRGRGLAPEPAAALLGAHHPERGGEGAGRALG